MARPVDIEKKNSLRELAADYLLDHGLTEFSLRPLAKALGTSARMLMHHFGSREGLLEDAMQTIRDRERGELARWTRRQRVESPALDTTLNWHWRRLAAPDMRPKLRQLFELYVLALRDPRIAAWAIKSPLAYWTDVLAATGTAADQNAWATLILATLRGLLLDLAAGGDRKRIRNALVTFAEMLPNAAATTKRDGGTPPQPRAKRRAQRRTTD